MIRIECAREQDVLDAIASRRWPSRCDDELRVHARECSVCADLVQVASAFLDAREIDEPGPELPPASLVWWRAQLRAREEAARLASRPLRAARIAAVSCASLLAIIALQTLLPAASHWMGAVLSWRPAIDADAAAALVVAAAANRAVQLAAVAWLILGPVALYLAFARD